MKKIVITLLLTILFSPVMAKDNNIMPQEFLGWWSPYSKTMAEVGMEIKADGTIDYRDDETKKFINSIPYRYLYRSSYKNYAYIIAYPDNDLNKPVFWQLEEYKSYPTNNEKERRLTIIQLQCITTKKEVQSLSNLEFEAAFKAQKCGPEGPPYKDGNSDTFGRTLP